MAEMSLLQALHVHAKDKARVMCMPGHVLKCVTSLNTSNSTKTQNVDIITRHSFPSHKLCPQRMSGSRDYVQPGTHGFVQHRAQK